jgi:hypothetical protein
LQLLAETLSADQNHLIRALGLLWGRLGPARSYIVASAVLLIGLAGIGLWHLVSPLKQTAFSPTVSNSKTTPPPASPARTAFARISPSAKLSSPAPAVIPELERRVAITDVTEKEERGRHGETFVVATIGMASRSNVEKELLEIRIFFYDLTPNNEMRPTDAQVTYQWLTPVRDWSDPTPKYLAATYLKSPASRGGAEKLHYGGFLVRVYLDGKLQDERSKPEGLIAQLRSNVAEQSPSPTAALSPPTLAGSTSVPPSSNRPAPSASPIASDPNLPYGKPISGKPGFVSSPYDPKFLIDVRGFPPGTLVIDPNTNKPFRVP